jgi:hypothetical protein
MRISTPRLACTGLAAFLMAGCGGGGGGSGSNTPPPGNVPVPTVTLGAAPADVTAGESSSLSWSSTNATGCTASNGWTGAKAASGSETIPNIQATTIYTLTCTGTGGTSNPVSTTVTAIPAAGETANAGPSRTVLSGATVRLSGEASVDPQGDALQYSWTQTAGTNVVLNGVATANPTFTAPSVTSDTALTFSLTVSDGAGAPSSPAAVSITVKPLAANDVLVKGRITFVRIPFSTSLNVGLDYTKPVNRPARGVIVLVNSAGTTTQLAAGETDSDGNFALSVPQNTPIDLRAVASMQRDASVPLPRWNFSVVDADLNTTPYFFTDGAFNSSTVTHDMSIPSGFNSGGTVTGTRASAPFAVLDTVYTAIQTIVGAAPDTNFPALLLDWAPGNPGGDTFFDSGGAGAQMIVLSADPAEDTDEFDQHVIAHEFGHYIEHNFSRADNIGGAHGLGDKLDIRVAFGEGFGYAFAAIALKDPIARDSFVTDNNGTPQLVSSTFNVETNPSQNAPGTPSGNFGCWCSESSVWSLLWDMYDGAADANDGVALGFQPMWDVLIDEQRTTPAMTSIFTFTAALKDAQPAQASAIDTLLAGQNISPVTDALGATETHFPTPVASAAALPVYTSLTAGSPVTVRSVNDAGHFNTLGNHRFVRYVKSGSTGQTVTVTSNGTDPDVVAYRNGQFALAARGAGNESFTITTAGTYVFDVYECSNGCEVEQGTPGDYDVTVTVN